MVLQSVVHLSSMMFMRNRLSIDVDYRIALCVYRQLHETEPHRNSIDWKILHLENQVVAISTWRYGAHHKSSGSEC